VLPQTINALGGQAKPWRVRQRERSAEEHEGKEAQAIGRECEKVTAARRVISFFKETRVLIRETLPRAPQFQGNLVYDTRARVHKSYGLCAELQVRKKRTATCAECGVVGGIYNPNHQTSRLVKAAVDGRNGQSGAPPDTVRCASHVTWPLGSDRWSSDLWVRLAVRWRTGQVL
jgi:hypothetical protein